MTKICNFPITRGRRCKQPIAGDEPNCGRHSSNLSADQVGQDPTVHRKNGELHVWDGKPNGLYCLIHNDPAYQVLCQLSGEKVPYCLNDTVTHKDNDGYLHRDDGPAVIKPDGTQYWYQHGKLHRDGGPAEIWHSGVQKWWQHGEQHRDDGPAVVFPNGTRFWYQHDQLHRDDGPAEIHADGTQEWYWRDKLHRDDGPAAVCPSGIRDWYWHGEKVTEREHAELRAQSQGV